MTRDCVGDEGRGVTAKCFGEVSSNLWSGDIRMGKPRVAKVTWLRCKSESKPAEVKHFSKRRKRKQIAIPLVAASEKGTAQISFFIIYLMGSEKL